MMNKIDTKQSQWDDSGRARDYSKFLRDRDVADCLNSIIDFLENDLKKEIESIVDKKIESRFEIMDL